MTGEVITLTTWTQHIPCVFPPFEQIGLLRKKKKLFRTIDEKGVISHVTFMRTFGDYLEPYQFEHTYILHPDKAAALADLFNSVEFESPLEGFCSEGLQIERVTNAVRSPEQMPLR